MSIWVEILIWLAVNIAVIWAFDLLLGEGQSFVLILAVSAIVTVVSLLMNSITGFYGVLAAILYPVVAFFTVKPLLGYEARPAIFIAIVLSVSQAFSVMVTGGSGAKLPDAGEALETVDKFIQERGSLE